MVNCVVPRARVSGNAVGLLFFALIAVSAVRGANPLVTDDADTVEAGHFQLNSGVQFARKGSELLISCPLNLVGGLNSRAELGATFGYVSRLGDGAAPDEQSADGVMDLLLASKWRLWQTAGNAFKLTARMDLKVPTASSHRGFGTGQVDVAAVLIGTRRFGHTSLDWNIGHSAINAAEGIFHDDHVFFGQAVRHELNEHWTLIGEAFAELPLGDEAAPAEIHFRGGAQWVVREEFLISALIGTAAGSQSPDVTGLIGFTFAF